MTTADGSHWWRLTRQRRLIALSLLFIVFATIRMVALNADPPTGLSWSAGIFTDEGIYALDARSVALTGHWAAGDFHSALVAPILHLIQIGVFKTAGAGLIQARLVSVSFSLATLLLFYAALKVKYGERTALIGTIFLGLSVPYVLYNRLALLETPTLFVLVAAYYAWAYGASNMLIGCLLGMAFVFKPLALIASPAFVLAAWPERRGAALTVIGMLAVLVAYGLLWYLPHQAALARMNHYYAFHQYLPHSWGGLRHDLSRGLWTGNADGILPYLLEHDAFLMIFALPAIVTSRKTQDERLLALWLIVPILVFLFLSYTPSRYFVLFWPPLAALAAWTVTKMQRPIAVCIVAIYATVSLFELTVAWTTRAYTVQNAQLQLTRKLPPRTVVAGQFAPILCLSNDTLIPVYVQPGLADLNRANDSDRMLAIVVTRSPYWDGWWHQREPNRIGLPPEMTLDIARMYREDIYYASRKQATSNGDKAGGR